MGRDGEVLSETENRVPKMTNPVSGVTLLNGHKMSLLRIKAVCNNCPPSEHSDPTHIESPSRSSTARTRWPTTGTSMRFRGTSAGGTCPGRRTSTESTGGLIGGNDHFFLRRRVIELILDKLPFTEYVEADNFVVGSVIYSKGHASSIFRQSSNPGCGFSRLSAVWPMENWLVSSMNHRVGSLSV